MLEASTHARPNIPGQSAVEEFQCLSPDSMKIEGTLLSTRVFSDEVQQVFTNQTYLRVLTAFKKWCQARDVLLEHLALKYVFQFLQDRVEKKPSGAGLSNLGLHRTFLAVGTYVQVLYHSSTGYEN